MSRIETGALEQVTRPVACDELVAGLAARTGIELALPDDLPLVDADPGLLERALANIVENALRHAGGRPVRVEGTDGGDVVRLRIVDHGPGVPAAERARMFEPFQRLGDRSGTGVGLGLAVAHGFVAAMGGTVEPGETPGGGLTMTVTLPRHRDQRSDRDPVQGFAP